MLLDGLETFPAVLVMVTATAQLRLALTRTEARRSAGSPVLDRVGVADLGHVTVTWNGRRASCLSLARPGTDANDPSQVRWPDSKRRPEVSARSAPPGSRQPV